MDFLVIRVLTMHWFHVKTSIKEKTALNGRAITKIIDNRSSMEVL